MKQKTDYAFVMNVNPSDKELDAAMEAIYNLSMSGAALYKYQCPVNYEELGAYVFNRIVKILNKDAAKAGLEESWQNGLRLWMSELSWKTAPAYIRSLLSTGFIDYSRSFYSEFKHQPTDAQEKLYLFDRLVQDNDKLSLFDLQQAFALLSTKERKSIYSRITRCKNKDPEGFAGFSAEFGGWFDSLSNPEVISIQELEDLTTSQITAIRNGRLAIKHKGSVWLNVQVDHLDDNQIKVSLF